MNEHPFWARFDRAMGHAVVLATVFGVVTVVATLLTTPLGPLQ